MAEIHFLPVMCFLCFRFLCRPGTTMPNSIKSARVWVDNTKGFPLNELYCEWIEGCSLRFLQECALEIVLLDLPGLLFFSTYTLLVLFWAEIYYQARSLPINKLRPTYYSINGFVYFAQACIWIAVRLSQSLLAVEIARLFISVISLCAALGFMIYGGRLFFMLRRFPIESRGRQKKLLEVGCVTGICCTCFFIRCFVVTLSAFDKNADLDVLDHPILNLIYYM
ncbi:Tobamovirus multiplication 1 isoform 4 [Theobroma cacao]|uniref:Tobamovirus multiplication 1 isoform 4 n=1 Tax=Theobroma cacao TaxID=3641 RepID=A0A061E1G0_THECC|nr:Tobamovirus multiplication 1 isoform 4 [Theobroma cacao]